MGKIVIKGYRTPLVLGDENGKALTDENGTLIEVVLVPDAGNLSLVKRGKSTIVSARQNKALLSDDTVTLSVRANTPLDIRVNDWFEVYGEVYRINTPPKIQKNNTFSFEYEITGQGIMYDMLRCKFFNADSSGFKTTMDFPLIGTIETFLLVLKANMQRLSVDWEIGNFTNGETKTITFSNDTCLSALQKICQEFETEFWVKYENGKYVIHTGAFGSTLPVALEYGKGKGLYNLSRKNVNEEGIITRLYVAGGTQNIPASYRDYSERLKFSDDGFLEDAALTSSIGLREGAITFDDIYPHRTGSVTTANSVVKFTDTAMDFDLNEKEADGVTTKYLIAGTTAKIHFNTGNLAGYEFEVKSYNHATKEFEIIPFDNQNGQVFPDENSAAFQFGVGDEYVLLDIVMPQSYIDNAEAELLTKGTEQFNLLKQSKVSYDLDLAEDFLKNLSTPLNIGDLVHVVDTQLGIDKVLRINQITRNFIENGTPNDYNYKIVIADSYEVAFASKLVLEIQKVKNIINVNKIDQLRLSRIGLQVTDDLRDAIFDPDGKLDTTIIRENSIEANMLTVGSRSQAISTSLVFQTNVGGNPNAVKIDPFVIFSQTMLKQWSVSGLTTTLTNNSLRYVYGKVSKTSTTGSVHITTEQITYDSDPNDYYILLGILSSVVENTRVFVPTYGLTTITGGLIRTGIISDQLGTFQINLNTGVITADKITFKAPDNSYKDLTDTIGGIDANLANLNLVRDYINNVLPGELETIQNQIDGSITNWFYGYAPTLSNLPASDWTTTEIKNIHLGDVFYDTITGYSYRFKVVNNVYSWERITDSDITKALADAAAAQDTADNKRRVFVVQPIPPYDIGDLWTQGASGDIMRCATSRLSGAYVAGDWVKASKYTDDTRAIQAEANAKLYADGLKTQIDEEISDINDILGDLDTYIDGAFFDGVVETSEARAIEKYLNDIDTQKSDLDARYNTLYNDSELTGTPKTNLASAKTNYNNSHSALKTAINSAISDGKTTPAEKTAVDNAFIDYRAKLALLTTAMEVAVDAIAQTKATKALTDANAFTQSKIDAVNLELGDVDTRITSLQDFTNTAFKDGVIDFAEKEGLKSQLKSIETEKQDIDSQYTSVYGSSSLTGTPKTNLNNAKTDYNTKHTTLVNAINNAIADDIITPAEKSAIDTAFANYKTSLGTLRTRFEEAIRAIEDNKINALSTTLNTSIANSLTAAKNYSDTELNAREITIKSYADGIVDAEEARAIADATAKADAAKAYADAQDLLLTTQLEAYADGAVSTEETARIAQAQANLQAAKDYADAQANAARVTAEAYADGAVDAEEARAISDANTKLNTAKAYAEAQDSLLRTELQVYADGKVSTEESARLAQAATNLQAAKDYAAAEDALKETSIKAYADGKVDAAEQRSITDATNKAEAAKTYAVAQDNLLKTQLEAYTDDKISVEEQARIDAALQAIEAAQDYTDKQAILSKIAFEAYADGKVDAEEAARIAEAERAMNEAKEYAESLLDGKKIGAKQLLREYDTRFNYAYWGGSGSGNEYDLDTIDPVEAIVLGFGVNTAIVDENNKFFEIIF